MLPLTYATLKPAKPSRWEWLRTIILIALGAGAVGYDQYRDAQFNAELQNQYDKGL